jgi:hypothetical protein
VHVFDRLASLILRSPLLWGALLSVAFYAPIHAGYLTHPMLVRYVAGHWIEYVEVIMFFIGLSALAVKALEVGSQFGSVRDPLLVATPLGGQPLADCPTLLEQLARAPLSMQGGYLWQRLRSALDYVQRKESADSLDEEIKYLSDVDYSRCNHSYAFVRIIIWAIPILGFLGTVIGITIALAELDPQKLEASLNEVTGGLGVAFDTTAIALALAMVLMFGQYVVERVERRLLAEVDERMNCELVGRFQEAGAGRDPEVASVKRMIESLLAGTERLVARQAELWQGSIEAANARWQQLSGTAGKQLETSLSVAMDRSLKSYALQLAANEQSAAEQSRKHWSQVQAAVVQSAETLGRQQAELAKHGEVLLKVVDATGHVQQLETELNRNLKALAGAKHFEETVLSLAAAVQLLSARLGSTADIRQVQLELPKRTGQAA